MLVKCVHVEMYVIMLCLCFFVFHLIGRWVGRYTSSVPSHVIRCERLRNPVICELKWSMSFIRQSSHIVSDYEFLKCLSVSECSLLIALRFKAYLPTNVVFHCKSVPMQYCRCIPPMVAIQKLLLHRSSNLKPKIYCPGIT